ncbi:MULTISPECIES: LpqB family beta-propeller domain-containing protein [Streptomyces]|uniref:Lipoprotein LpqB n=1 Tax=Streptomyces spinosisporus TaxID=2927582 RepID=A0ABS9XTA5_9ACTN|nr:MULTISPECIES: LpqB family beta-propeller domain-containing protein [Streptomyces]MCI3245185.1 LpqB family beta-propeller domain-containing protein [Streptomyces spinosisporus]WUB36348.1 LpqB family beta-propeller domain-containing protein [Streptomyces sp. NBC_00588]
MGADREGGAGRSPMRVLAYGICGVVLLSGCASMPDSGDVSGVDSTPRQDTQVRVFAMPPPDNALPSDIVSGFLEALTSDDPNYSTARQYLTKEASQAWRPGQSSTVLADGPGIDSNRLGGREDGNDLSFTLTGKKVARVDSQQAYSPASGVYNAPVHLTRDKKTNQWRIDRLPQGVVMGKSDFQRNYLPVNKYYFATNASAGTASHPTAVADPVYVRRRVDPMTQMVRSLLNGPTNWLDPVVRTSFPTGTELQKGVNTLTPDDQNRLTVPLNAKAAKVGTHRCTEMAAQVLFTLQNLTPAVDEVELRSGDEQLCSLSEDQPGAAAVRGTARDPGYVYFLDDKSRLVRIAAGNNGTKAEPVPGALGEGSRALKSVAVSRDEDTGAAVSGDGKDLYVAPLAAVGSLADPVLTSRGKTEKDRLTAPSWDSHGDLWIADRDPDDPRLLLLEQGRGEPVVVKIPELDGRIQAVRVAADGVRVALVVAKGDKTSLVIGRIERRQETGEDRPTVSVLELRPASPELESVTAMSWAGDSRLVVAGREQGGVQTMRYVQADGSTPEGPAPAALSGIKEITAADSDSLPMVAYSEDGIVRLQSGAQWQKVTDGVAPVYPG